MATYLERLLEAGDLHRLAAEHGTVAGLAKAIGMSAETFSRKCRQLRAQSVPMPTFPELAAGRRDIDTVIEKSMDAPGLNHDVRFGNHSEAPKGSPARSVITKGDNADFAEEEPTNPSAPPLAAIGKGFRVRHKSTLVDGETGETKLQWIKTTAIDDGRQEWLEAIRSIGEALPRIEPVEAPEYGDDDLLSVYPVGDPHVGLLAWHEDAGENFDLKIAERNLVGAFGHLIALSPPSRRALLIFIGDNTHSDGQANTTTKGTRVDVDGRTILMARVFVDICRRSIALALTKHEHATIIIERGNHDELLSAMLAFALSLLYESEPRVTVDVSPEMFHWYRFGEVLIGTHHGHNVKPMDLLGVMAVDRKEDWGQTTHRRIYTGHYHHTMTKEVPGIIIETLPTLAGADAWHRGMGYRSQRAMYMDVIHRKHGHINRHIVGIQQITERVA